MPKRQIPPFYLAVICEAAELFCIKGPITDDSVETNEIGQMAGDGFSIRCFTCGEGTREMSRDAVLGIYPDYQEVTYSKIISAAGKTKK